MDDQESLLKELRAIRELLEKMDSAARQRREDFTWVLSFIPWVGAAICFLAAARGFGWI
jgi:hypothetical protein